MEASPEADTGSHGTETFGTVSAGGGGATLFAVSANISGVIDSVSSVGGKLAGLGRGGLVMIFCGGKGRGDVRPDEGFQGDVVDSASDEDTAASANASS